MKVKKLCINVLITFANSCCSVGEARAATQWQRLLK